MGGKLNLTIRPNTGLSLQRISATDWIVAGAGGSAGGGSVIAVDANQVSGTANAITLSPDPAIPTLYEGLSLRFVAKGTNTGAVTVSVNGGSAVNVAQNGDGDAVAVGYIAEHYVIDLVYDGTRFVATSSVRTTPGILGLTTARLAARPTPLP